MLKRFVPILSVALLVAFIGCGGEEETTGTGDGTGITKEEYETLWSVKFMDAQEGWAVGEKNVILHTIDGGVNWESQTENVQWLDAEPASYIFFSVEFTDNQNGWIVGGTKTGAGVVLKTIDGGATWTQIELPEGQATLRDITIQSDPSVGEAAWAVGIGGSVLYSEDGGETWVAQNSSVSKDLFSVTSIGYYQGGWQVWAAGQDGTIIHTSDGVTWEAQDSRITTSLQSIYFTDVSSTNERMFRGWAVGLSGKGLFTSDMGQRWNDQDTKADTSQHLRDVFFLPHTQTGWIVGDGGLVRYTDDAGREWRPRATGVFKPVYSVCFINTRKGWAVGKEGVIVSTEDGGSNWKILRGSAF